MTPGEIKANIEELENIERMIKRREYRFADMTDQQIKNELEHYGSQKNAFEIAFGYDHPEAYEQYIKSKPEKKAEGGAMGLDYLTGQEPPKNGYARGGRIGYADGSDDAPSITLDTYEKASDNEIFGSKLPETKSGIGGLYYGFKEQQRPIVIDPNTGKPIDSGNLKELKKVFSSLLSDSRPEIGYATDKFNVGASKGINPFGDKSLRYGASYYPDKDQTFFLDAGPDYKTAGYLYKPNEAGSISLTGSKGSFGDKNFSLRGEYKFAEGGRINLQKGSIPKILEFLIDKLSKEKNFNKTLLEKSSPKAIQDLYIEKYGSLPSAEEIKDIVNKQLQNKGSMEVMNPKTGEVTTPKNPIMTVEDLQFKHKEAFKAHDQIFNVDINDKIAPDMIAESMAEMKGKDYFSLSQKEQSDLYKKALAYVDDVRMTKRQNKPIEGGFSFNDPDIKAQMEEAMTVAKKRGDEMRAMGLDPAKSKDYDEYIKIKEASGDKNFNKYFDDLEIKTKFKGRISDDLLNQILMDDNLQRKAEVVASIEQGLVMQEKGMSPEQIVDILKNTKRTKQAQGGPIGLNYLMGF
jgi:hypothetical protein